MADSLVYYKPKKVKQPIEENNSLIFSTGTHYYKIEFTNSRNEQISLFTSDNYSDIDYLEWTLNIDGFEFSFRDISFSENINTAFNWNLFDSDISLDQAGLFHKIVCSEYEKLHRDKPVYED